MRILLVDDDKTARLAMSKLFGKYGTHEMADNGKTAIDMVSDSIGSGTPYDLICLDIEMPEIDGHEALIKIRELESESELPAAKIMMLTAHKEPDHLNQAYAGACDVYCVKPLTSMKIQKQLSFLGLI